MNNTQEHNLFDSIIDSICLTRLRKWLSVTFDKANNAARTNKFYEVGYATALYDCIDALERICKEIDRELICLGKVNDLDGEVAGGKE